MIGQHVLHKDQKSEKWRLEEEGSDRAVKLFDWKADATRGGALSDAIGKAGGSVRIRKLGNSIQEERTLRPAALGHPGRVSAHGRSHVAAILGASLPLAPSTRQRAADL